MRRTDLLLLLSASVTLSAQQRRFTTQIAHHPLVFGVGGCPVSFGAEVDGRAVMRSTEDGIRDANAPLLKLTFLHPKTPLIKGATVTVHGFSAAGRYLEVSDQTPEDRTETFDLTPHPDASDLALSEVSVSKMALVRWAEVTELLYADGSSWHPSSNAQCHAIPSKFHLVDATAQ